MQRLEHTQLQCRSRSSKQIYSWHLHRGRHTAEHQKWTTKATRKGPLSRLLASPSITTAASTIYQLSAKASACHTTWYSFCSPTSTLAAPRFTMSLTAPGHHSSGQFARIDLFPGVCHSYGSCHVGSRNSFGQDILITYSFCRVFAVNDSGSKMHIVDREGRVILTLKSKFFSAHNKWYIYSGGSTNKEDKIATVKPQTGTVTAEVLSMPWQVLLWSSSACAAFLPTKLKLTIYCHISSRICQSCLFHSVMVACRCF